MTIKKFEHKAPGKLVDSFGEHYPSYRGYQAIDFIEAELHADGSYTLYIDATEYLNTLTGQWFSTPESVVEVQYGEEFLNLEDEKEVEEEAERIAQIANAEIFHHYIENPDQPVEEVMVAEYEKLYGGSAPTFNVTIYGAVEVVDVGDLVEYWQENRTDGRFVGAFGDRYCFQYSGGAGQWILDLVRPQLHSDGSYTLHLNSHFYVNSLRDQWFSTPGGVLEFHGDGFLDISTRDAAEKAAEEIADAANKEIQEHYVDSPDMPLEEIVINEYEHDCRAMPPEFILKTYGTVHVVEANELVEYWEENRSED